MAYEQTIKDLYASNLTEALAQREAQKRKALEGYTNQETSLAKSYSAQLPQYQQQRDDASNQAFQLQQGLQNRAAAMGNYRAGSMQTEIGRNSRALGTNIANSFKQQNDYTNEYASNRDKLRALMGQEETDYTRDEGLMKQKNAAEMASALGQWQQSQADRAASMAKASSGGSSRYDTAATNDAMSTLDQFAQRLDIDEQDIKDFVENNAYEFQRAGVDLATFRLYAKKYQGGDWMKRRNESYIDPVTGEVPW